MVCALCANGSSNNPQNWGRGLLLVKNHLSLLRKCKRWSQGCSSPGVLRLLKSTKMQVTWSNPCQSTLAKFQTVKAALFHQTSCSEGTEGRAGIHHCINNSQDFVYLIICSWSYISQCIVCYLIKNDTSYLTSMAHETDRITQAGLMYASFSVSELLFFPIQVNGSGKRAQK